MTEAVVQQWEVRYYDSDTRSQDVVGPFDSYEAALSDARDRRQAGYAAWIEHYRSRTSGKAASVVASAGVAPRRRSA